MGRNDERRQPRPSRKLSDEFKHDAVDPELTTGRPVAKGRELLADTDAGARGAWRSSGRFGLTWHGRPPALRDGLLALARTTLDEVMTHGPYGPAAKLDEELTRELKRRG